MKDRTRQNGRPKPGEDFPEFGEVRVISRCAPDAEDRLRRLFTLLLKPSASDGQSAPEKESSPDDRQADDHQKAEA